MYEIKTLGYANFWSNDRNSMVNVVANESKDSVLIDVRCSPYGQIMKETLQKAMTNNYRWIEEFGNEKMLNAEHFDLSKERLITGMKRVLGFCAENNTESIIFMCAEKYVDECHRLIVAKLAKEFLEERVDYPVKVFHLGSGFRNEKNRILETQPQRGLDKF